MGEMEGVIKCEGDYVEREEGMEEICVEKSMKEVRYKGIGLGEWGLSGVQVGKERGEEDMKGVMMENEKEVMSIEG